MSRRVTIKEIFNLGKLSVFHLSDNNPLLLAASTAFFATFSLAPIVLIIVTLLGVFISDQVMRSETLERIGVLFGKESIETVENVFFNLKGLSQNWYFSVFGFLVLIFISTTLLIVVQASLNQLWGIKQKSERHLLRMIKDRLIGLLIIMASGLLIFASFIIQWSLAFLRQYLDQFTFDINLPLLEIINELVSFLIVVIWFAVIYKFLPAAKISWKPLWIGSLVTSFLFSMGRFLLVRMIPGSNISSIYGASGSIMLILLFVFYSGMIFYLGASFTKVFADFAGYKIQPKSYSVRIKIVEMDKS